MFTKCKYVIGVTRDGSRLAVIGPETINHTDLALVFTEVKSAGFCHYAEDDVKVYGESFGLKLKSDPEKDKRYIGTAMAHPKYYT